jgi:nucleotidyltransferase substrate binding protein (TIGR01987 family)
MKELAEAVNKKEYSVLERAGLIQLFEMTFELAWKTMKDYLEEKGITVKFPRDVIKESFQNDIVENGHAWIGMLEKRNLLSHTYDEQKATEAARLIREDFFPELKQVFAFFKSRV